jgi:NAD+ synthase (glutamine-hydrolysing)
MTYSNDFNWMVLACGNKSEAAMGYCTLYGDTCGAVMPIGDLYKTQIYEMANLFNTIPRGIITRPASAELSLNQKDTDSLPEYNVLDSILAHIENGTEHLVADKKLLGSIKKQYNRMVFKRIQCPPVLKTRIK